MLVRLFGIRLALRLLSGKFRIIVEYHVERLIPSGDMSNLDFGDFQASLVQEFVNIRDLVTFDMGYHIIILVVSFF